MLFYSTRSNTLRVGLSIDGTSNPSSKKPRSFQRSNRSLYFVSISQNHSERIELDNSDCLINTRLNIVEPKSRWLEYVKGSSTKYVDEIFRESFQSSQEVDALKYLSFEAQDKTRVFSSKDARFNWNCSIKFERRKCSKRSGWRIKRIGQEGKTSRQANQR